MTTGTDHFGSGAQSSAAYRLWAAGREAITLACEAITLATRPIALACGATGTAMQLIPAQSDRPVTTANQAITHPYATPAQLLQVTCLQMDTNPHW